MKSKKSNLVTKLVVIYYESNFAFMDIEELVKKAKEIGHDEIPNPKPVQVEKLILEVLNSNPTRCFRSYELNELVRYEGIRTPSSGILSRLASEGEIERIKPGLYRAKLQGTPIRSLLEKIRSMINKITGEFFE